jgi:broad specificity phosphatase PhoE
MLGRAVRGRSQVTRRASLTGKPGHQRQSRRPETSVKFLLLCAAQCFDNALDFSRGAASDCRESARTGEIIVTIRRFVAVLVVAVLAAGCGSARAAGPRTIVLTLVRHGQSAANASGLIDTSTPGPELTSRGWCQATLAAAQLAPNHYDGIYASSMIRTQDTATPTAQTLGEPVTVLPGLREIEAGQYEGTPESNIPQTYFAAPQRWLQGDRSARIPGSVNGNEFDARFDEAVQHIYDSGEQNPVAFSHSGAIMFWVLMNVRNADPSLLTTKPLPNVGRVVITGNPSDGWTLTEWDADPPPC